MKARILLIAAMLATLSSRTEAKSWIVDYQHSHLGFSGIQERSVFQGSFRNFKVDIDFDPDHPESGKIAATIETGNVTTNDRQRDSMLPQTEWFDAQKFPEAKFTSTKIQKTDAHSYEAKGTLTLKGITKNVTLPFTLTQDGDHWRAQGRAMLVRSDFHIGEGEWASDQTVRLVVTVIVDIAARPQN